MPELAGLLFGGAVFLFLAYMVRARALRPVESRLRVLSPRVSVSVSTSADGATLLRRDPRSTLIGKLVNTSTYAQRWQFELERADLKLRPSEYFLVRVAIAAVTVIIVTLIGRNGPAFLVSLPLAAITYMMPAYWVRFRTMRRIAEIDKQLPETVTLIANGLRAGFAFGQSLDTAAKRIGPPMSVELGRVLLDVNLGMSTEDALRAMNERIGSDDVDMLVTAILVQRNSGGNLAEVLENVAHTIRDRERIRGEIRTLTASQRFTGWVLTLWPLALALIFVAMVPDIMSLMWTTEAGRVMMGIWFALNVLGAFSLRRILDIDI